MSDKYPRVTEILRSEGFVDFSKVGEDVMERAQAFGQAVHRAAALDDIGDLNERTLSGDLKPYLEAWRKFKSDYRIEYSKRMIEVSLVSAKWKFRGTPDRLPVKIKGKHTLVDIKSSTTMLPFISLQTAAYAILCDEAKLKTEQRWGVKLCPDGRYEIEIYKEASDRSIFISALQIYNWKKIHLNRKDS